ncbi:NrpR regulatory domain-containing protein [Halarchaeum acidiphilum]|nr:NrpR regulatory domain-containing protein [Halarchaeum acidiphilum]
MVNLDPRTYDLLRIVREHSPIGSIRLTDEMQRRGYSIQDRTIRLTLSELDEAGLTEKIPGRGRHLTEEGRRELERGDVTGRLNDVRERIATLTSQVTYDPADDIGDVVTVTATVDAAAVPDALERLEALEATPIGPVPTDIEETDEGDVRLFVPSSITLGGVLLMRGIQAPLQTGGLIQYDPTAAARDDDTGRDPRVVRYVDAINGEGSSMDVVSLLVEAGRTDITSVLRGEESTLIADNRGFPILNLEETVDITAATVERLGGVMDIRRPRESSTLPQGRPNFDLASLTYAGAGELAVSLLFEDGLVEEWSSLADLRDRVSFCEPAALRHEPAVVRALK